MGLYDDIQADISDAFANDLFDAVKTLTITRETVGSYNPNTGSPSVTTTVASMRCVVVSDVTGEKLDEDSSTDEIVVLVLDSDKTVSSFELGDNANVNNSDYVIKGIIPDPLGATHTLKCRKF